MDWSRQKNAVIKRVFKRGKESEKMEITNFHGKEAINDVLNLIEK